MSDAICLTALFAGICYLSWLNRRADGGEVTLLQGGLLRLVQPSHGAAAHQPHHALRPRLLGLARPSQEIHGPDLRPERDDNDGRKDEKMEGADAVAVDGNVVVHHGRPPFAFEEYTTRAARLEARKLRRSGEREKARTGGCPSWPMNT